MEMRLPRTCRSVALAARRAAPGRRSGCCPAGWLRGRIGQELQDRQRGDRLAGAASRRPAPAVSPALDVERDAIDGRDGSPALARRRPPRSRTSSSGRRVHRHERLARIEGVAHRLADEDQQHSITARTTKPVKPSHGAWRLALPCARSSPSDGEPGGRPKPRKSSEVSVVTSRQDERQKVRSRPSRWAGVAEHDDRGSTRRARAPPGRSRNCAPRRNSARTTPTSAIQVNSSMSRAATRSVGSMKLARMISRVERRQRRPDLDEALEQQVDPAAEIALHRAGGDADDRRQERQRPGRTAPRCESRRSAAPARRGPGRRCRASCIRGRGSLEILLLDHRLALLLGQLPGRR